MRSVFLALFLSLAFIISAQTPSASPYRVVAYYTGNGTAVRDYPLNRITHIICSFLRVRGDTLGFADSNQERSVLQIVALKKEFPRLKVMVSIGGWGGCAFCSELFSTPEHRDQFAKLTVDFFKRTGIDGLDLDWEYPAIEGYPGHLYTPEDRDHFTELVRALRREMGKDFLLSFASGGFKSYVDKSVDWKQVMPQVDFVNLMTYDLVNGYSTVTGHHTALGGKKKPVESVRHNVEQLLAQGCESSKLVVGAAIYARIWDSVPPVKHGLYQSGHFRQGLSYRNFSDVLTEANGFRFYWDKKVKAPYCYSAEKGWFATFDDPRSVRAKAAYVKKMKLGGMMYWQLSEDKPQGGLTEAIADALDRP